MLTTQDSSSAREAHEYCICCIRADSDTEELTFLKQTSRCVLSWLDFLLSHSCRRELELLWKNTVKSKTIVRQILMKHITNIQLKAAKEPQATSVTAKERKLPSAPRMLCCGYCFVAVSGVCGARRESFELD